MRNTVFISKPRDLFSLNFVWIRTRRITLPMVAAMLFVTFPATQSAEAAIIRYTLGAFPVGSTDVGLSNSTFAYTLYPGGDIDENPVTNTAGPASISFDFDTEVDNIVAIRTINFGNQSFYSVANGDFITGFTSGSGINSGQTQIVAEGNSLAAANSSTISIVVEGDLSLGGRIDLVPFNPDALSRITSGFSPLDPTLDSFQFTLGSARFGTMFLDTALPGNINVLLSNFDERGGPTLGNLTSNPSVEYFFYATPVPEPGTATILITGLFLLGAHRCRRA